MPMHRSGLKKSTNVRARLLRPLARVLSRVAPGPASRLAERLFITVPRAPVPRREQEWARGARLGELRSDRGPLRAWEWGEGPRVVLLVHGWAGRGLQLGALVAPLVERGFRVVAFDGPGHGAAERRTSSMPEIAAAIAAVAREVGPLTGVVAHSLGVPAVIMAAACGDLDLARVVAIAPPARLDAIGQRFVEMTGFSTEVFDRMRRRLEDRLGFDWAAIEPLGLAPGMTPALLVIHDRDDEDIPHAEGAALATSWPGAELVTTSGLGHRRVLRDPGVIRAAVAFLDRGEPDRAAPRSQRLPARRARVPAGRPRGQRLVAWLSWLAARPACLAFDLGSALVEEADIELDLAYGRE